MALVPSGFFALRTPLLPAGDGFDARPATRDLPEVREALFIASPDFEAAVDTWLARPRGDDGSRVERTLVRYVARMSMRPTPFGLFAGTSVGTVGGRTRLDLAPRSSYRRHVRLDAGYLHDLISAVSRDPGVRATVRYRPNGTVYTVASRARYVERSTPAGANERERSKAEQPTGNHRLADISETQYLRDALARARRDPDGATIDEVVAVLVDAGASHVAAHRFVLDLVDAQLLLPTLPLLVTGATSLTPLVAALSANSASTSVAATLREVDLAIARLNEAELGIDVARWRALAETLETLPASVDRSRLFHVEMTKPAPGATLSRSVVAEIARGAELLQRLALPSPDPLADFRRRFAERYGERAIPLLEALDDDTGIGLGSFDDAGVDDEALIQFRSTAAAPTRDAWLLARIHDPEVRAAGELVLDRHAVDALAALAPSPALALPHALGVLVTLVSPSGAAADRGEFVVVLHGFSGPSGARLLGRFCLGDAELEACVRRHLAAEEALDPDARFAEIVHLPAPRMGNILARPVLRDYEIVYAGDSGAPHERQIAAADLLVSVEDDVIVLRSRTGQRIVPRLTSAHNFALGVPVYRFLGLMQEQGVLSASSWSWGGAGAMPYLPRLRVGRLVLSLARWRVTPDEVRALRGRSNVDLPNRIRAWRDRRGIPRHVAVVDAGGALPIDLERSTGVSILLQLPQGRASGVILEEIYPDVDDLCVSGPEGRFRHELVVPFVSSARAASSPASRRAEPPRPATQRAAGPVRRFAPASEWLYAKLYAGPVVADRLLRDMVAPLVARAREAGWMDRWFFIRYADPEHHLRLRFHGSPDVLLQTLLPTLRDAAAPWLETDALWRVQLDTYEPEVDRYGGVHGIELAERVFEADSDASLEILALRLSRDDRRHVTLCGINALFVDLELGVEARYALVKRLREVCRRRLSPGAVNALNLAERFRADRPVLEALIGAPEVAGGVLTSPLRRAMALLQARSDRLAPIMAQLRDVARRDRLTRSLEGLAASFAHMHAIRILRDDVRAHEAAEYDSLTRLYESLLARAAPLTEV